MSAIAAQQQTLTVEAWTTQEQCYSSTILPWVEAFRNRRERRLKHPVHDFLFEYYQCKRRHITEWHPPIGVVLQGDEARKFLKNLNYSANENGVFLDPGKITEPVIRRSEWIRKLLEAAQTRPSQTNCYGLHEWAMIYKSDCIRHQDTPLRLEPEEVEKVIESNTIRCTHYDAFRFFTEQAIPFNTLQPKHEERKQNEQFGCIHFNMDLFKWCYKLHPWISSELMLDCFTLAMEARELDMRASPYDLRSYGYEAITIETPEGRLEYQSYQKALGDKGKLLASRLLEECYNTKLDFK